MNLDTLSVAAMTAVVVLTCGITFILHSLVLRDDGAGRIWALGFLAAILTTLAYAFWATDENAWWALAIGNAMFVVGIGCLWLGARRYNAHRVGPASVMVAIGAFAAYFAVLVPGPTGGRWAGALIQFIVLALFAGAGAGEALRGELGRTRTATGLALVLGLQALFCVVRLFFFVVTGPESVEFEQWLGSVTTSILTIPLIIVALLVCSVLIAKRSPRRASLARSAERTGADGILPHSAFFVMLEEVIARAQWRQELVAVVAVKIEDLEQISTAFGSEVARSVRDAWRLGVRRYPPAIAFTGEDGLSRLLVCTTAETTSDARRHAALIYRGVFEDLGAVAGGVIPVIGVGVALTSTFGYDAARLEIAARDAADAATLSVESSVLVGEAE